MIELEKTYLAKFIPEGLKDCKFKEVIDVYFPKASAHPKLRLRKSSDNYEMTKKEPVNEGDASHQKEQTILLTKPEFEALLEIEGKKVHKLRYYYEYKGRIAEVDVFQGELHGLVVVDFEFKEMKNKDNFEMPEFCLADITQEDFIAGGMVCGKSYKDIEEDLNRFNYKKLE
ncbi:MAG: hypothetical protein KKA65_00865 [Nanoarchaeota archaeon]|nr:hypothetical protein [Nanoarchaeota archaeon]MBU4242248.1 hypothetical protein [Nanoarchaeota archaeon]MBU4352273.1 hypothetical protein [Nanoarchaeota archaeon]MBU4456029.1 hypothetical protein [Nanoarchaeota archaeon]MCG2719539.1 hypothetical protein [Nanoarchaeota archaeon]